MSAFDGLIGHEAQVKLFQSAVAGKRLGHAYLLTGPEGIGKMKFARAAAMTLMCEDHGCGTCRNCVRIQNGSHPDFLMVTRPAEKRDIPISEIRRVLDSLSMRSFEGGGRVVIIEDADQLNIAGMNAFLKTLEEPPEGTTIFLTAAYRDRFPETIRSRCQVIAFPPIPQKDLAKALAGQLKLSAVDARRLAAWSEGSFGRAHALYEEGVLDRIAELPQFFRNIESGRISDEVNDWIKRLAAGAGKKDNQLQRERFKWEIDLLILALREVYRGMQGSHPDTPSSQMVAEMRDWVRRRSVHTIPDRIEKLLVLRLDVDRMVNIKLLVEQACLDLAA